MNPREACDRLGKIGILHSFAAAELEDLASALAWIHVRSGQTVVNHLSKERNIYLISEGVFQVGLVTAGGRAVAFRKLRGGGHFGELAVLTGAPRTTSVVAETDGLLAECGPDTFMTLFRTRPAFAEAVTASLARTVVLLSDRVFELATLEVRYRIYAELLRLARDGDQTADGILIRNAPTHETIAATIGAQREVVTRELGIIASDGVIKAGRRQLTICDIERLRAVMQRRAGMTASQFMD